MDYRKELIELLEKISEDGLEGAIPNLIAECVREANYKHNTENKMLRWTAQHCERLEHANQLGQFFDLDQCEMAYGIAGKRTTWTDYSTSDDDWDDSKYYEDFNEWWVSLTPKEQCEICSKIGYKL